MLVHHMAPKDSALSISGPCSWYVCSAFRLQSNSSIFCGSMFRIGTKACSGCTRSRNRAHEGL